MARSNWQNYQSRSSAHAGTAAWRRLRKEILDRDGWVCMIAGPGCRWDADIVDHIFPVAWGGNDAPENLRAACGTCHAAKTAAESRAGSAKRRGKRSPPKHPADYLYG